MNNATKLKKTEAAIDALLDLEGIVSEEHYRALLARLNTKAHHLSDELEREEELARRTHFEEIHFKRWADDTIDLY